MKWIASLGVSAVQLTVFGGEEITDYFIGRRGAYREILKTIDCLFKSGIAPRIQAFVNKNNINELSGIVSMIEDNNLAIRCQNIGKEFDFFIHQGSCEGENERFYQQWITDYDIALIPRVLINMSLKHFGVGSTENIFGKTEAEHYSELSKDSSTYNLVSEQPVFYIDGSFNVYPNYTAPSSFYCLGNLKNDGAEKITYNYMHNKSTAQSVMIGTQICKIVESCGNPNSRRLFLKGDYRAYLYNSFLQKYMTPDFEQ